MRRSISVPAAAVLAAGVGALSLPAGARAHSEDFHLVWQGVDVNRDARTATFTLTFDRTPEFLVDAGGGGAGPHAFQFEVDADTDRFDAPLLFDEIDSVIRGGEIQSSGGLPVRDAGGDGGPDAGGWGPVRATLPFELVDQTLTFTTGLQTLGDDDGRFRYRLITSDEGTLTGEIQGAIVPLPAAIGSGIIMLGGLGAAHVLRKSQR